MKREHRTTTTGRFAAPPFPDTPELAEQRAHSPTAQGVIRATRDLLTRGGLLAATDRRIHEHEYGPWTTGTVRYWFGSREGLFVQLAREEHLRRLDRVRRALRDAGVHNLSEVLSDLAHDEQHYRVSRALMDAALSMPDLAQQQHRLWEDWRQRMREIVEQLQQRGVIESGYDPDALSLFYGALLTGLASHREAAPDADLQAAFELLSGHITQVS